MGQALNDFLSRQRAVGEAITSGRGSGLENFIGSAISSMTREMIGLPASPELEAYRAQNPVGGIASQLLGFGVPYVGWANLGKLPLLGKLPAVQNFERFVATRGQSLGSASGAALRSVTRFAPFEAGRVAGAAIAGGDVGGTALEAGINLGIEATLGAAGGALRAYGSRTSRRRMMEAAGVGPGDSLQEAYAKINARLVAVSAEGAEATVVGNVQDALKAMREGILTQVPAGVAKGGRRIYSSGALEIGGAPGEAAEKGIAGAINRWWALPESGTQVGKESARGPISSEALDLLAGISKSDPLPHLQFPRELIARGRALRNFRGTLLNKLQPVGDIGWIGKEANEGLWLVVRRLPAAGDKGPFSFAPLDAQVRFNYSPTEQQFLTLRSELRAELAKIVPDHKVDLYAEARPFFEEHATQVLGRYVEEQKLIKVAMQETVEGTIRTLRHEGMHALLRTGRLTKDEHRVLIQAAESSWIDDFAIAERYPASKFSREDWTEEAIAEAFAHYLRTGKAPSVVARIFERLKEVIAAIRRAVTKSGFRTPEEIFNAATSGKIGARPEGFGFAPEVKNWMNRRPFALNLPPKAAAQADAERFVLFKTDNPALFFPEQELWGRRVAARAFTTDTVARLPDTGSPIAKALQDVFDMVDFQVVGGSRKGALPRLMTKLGADKLGDHELVGRIQDLTRKYIYPAFAQAGTNLRHRRLDVAMRYVFDQAENVGSKLLYGNLKLDAARGPVRAILHGGTYEGGIIQPIRAASQNARDEFHKVLESMSNFVAHYSDEIKAGDIDEGMYIDQMFGRGEISKEGHSLLRQIYAVDQELQRIRQTTEEALGIKSGYKPLFGHLLLTRTWEGTWRTSVLDGQGNRIWISGGKDRAASQKAAQDLINRSGGQGLRIGQTWGGDRASDLKEVLGLRTDLPEYRLLSQTQRQLNQAAAKPQFYKPRAKHEEERVGGALTDRPLTIKEMETIVTEHVERQLSHLAELTVRKGAYGELDRLRLEDPDAFETLMQRINDKAGVATPISRSINNATDAVLSPILGRNSATQIVHAANRFIYHMQLGMGNLMFPVVNALTFAQTTLPQIAYVLRAHPDMIQQYYSTFPVAGADGLIKGAVHSLNPLRIAWAGLRLMRNYDKDPVARELIERALNSRVIEPRFVERQIGSNADRIRRFKDIPKEGGYVDAIEAVSSFVPSMSERFSRGHSFFTGMVLGRDILKIADPDRLYQFAKEFTDNTMFLYSTADRARIITGPLGTAFGLFKNWQMHYMAWMFTYGREGFLRNNWAPLLWQTAGTWGVAGAKGLPAFAAADAFAEWASGQGIMENLYSWFGDADRDPWVAGGDSILPDAIYMGLPSLLGLSLTASTGAPFADPVRDAGQLMGFVQWDRAQALGKGIGAAIDDWSRTGRHPIRDDESRRAFVQALAPRSVFRVMQVAEDDILRSVSTGYASVGGLSAGERWMHALGFNPRWISLQQDVQRELWASQESLRASVQYYGKQIADAQAAGDWGEVTRFTRQASLRGLPLDSIFRSAESRREKQEEDTVSRQFAAAEVAAFRQLGLVR